MDAETIPESELDADRGDFVDYLARRLGVEAREARARLSAWLVAYEPPAKSGPRRALPQEPPEQSELARTA